VILVSYCIAYVMIVQFSRISFVFNRVFAGFWAVWRFYSVIAHPCCEDARSLPSFSISLEANLNGFCSLMREMQASSVAKRSACNSSSIEPMSIIFFYWTRLQVVIHCWKKEDFYLCYFLRNYRYTVNIQLILSNVGKESEFCFFKLALQNLIDDNFLI
jgi:hypothetical protein